MGLGIFMVSSICSILKPNHYIDHHIHANGGIGRHGVLMNSSSCLRGLQIQFAVELEHGSHPNGVFTRVLANASWDQVGKARGRAPRDVPGLGLRCLL